MKGSEPGKNEQLVLAVLEREGRAMSAYDLLDALRDKGIRAPVQIYRALEKLAEKHRVHRIESMNAYVACSHAHVCEGADCEHHSAVAFCICEQCGGVDEFALDHSPRTLDAVTRKTGFQPRELTFEVKGRCKDCRNA